MITDLTAFHSLTLDQSYTHAQKDFLHNVQLMANYDQVDQF
jgi:hypothetical protein